MRSPAPSGAIDKVGSFGKWTAISETGVIIPHSELSGGSAVYMLKENFDLTRLLSCSLRPGTFHLFDHLFELLGVRRCWI